MKRINLVALTVSLIAVPVVSHAQRPDTVKKEGTAAKVGRQTGTSIDKAAKTTEHNVKKGASATKTNAKNAEKATKTNVKNLKKNVKKVTS